MGIVANQIMYLAQIAQGHGFLDDVRILVNAGGQNISVGAVTISSSSLVKSLVLSIRTGALTSNGRASWHGR